MKTLLVLAVSVLLIVFVNLWVGVALIAGYVLGGKK
jgi:hypothetical protein